MDEITKLRAELSAKDAELRELKHDIKRHLQMCTDLTNELSESRAQVARLLLEGRKFHDEQHEYAYTNCCYISPKGDKSDCEFKALLASLPEQAKRDARVLALALKADQWESFIESVKEAGWIIPNDITDLCHTVRERK